MSSSSPIPSQGENLPEQGEKQTKRRQFKKIKSAAVVHFKSGRATPAFPSCRPRASSPAHPTNILPARRTPRPPPVASQPSQKEPRGEIFIWILIFI